MNGTDELKPKLSRILIATTLFLLGFGRQVASPAEPANLAAADAGFAFKLLKQITRNQPGANICVSPYSAFTVLQMACSGAGGQTKVEMARVLGTTGLSTNALNAAIRDVAKSLNSGSTNGVMTTANALWYRKETPLKPEFISDNQNFFGATVDALDFNDPRSIGIINAWASEKTHGKISGIVDGLINPASE